MQDAVYAVTEIVGSSSKSLEDATSNAVQTCAKPLRKLEWFEVTQIRGHVENGDVAHFQVILKIGLRHEADKK